MKGLGWKKYKKREINQAQNIVKEFMHFYHFEKPHLSLQMMTPHEFVSHLNKKSKILHQLKNTLISVLKLKRSFSSLL